MHAELLSFLFVIIVVSGLISFPSDKMTFLVEHFRCNKPQPRAYSIKELTNAAEEFIDLFVVLHRCDRAGCCFSDKESCLPLTAEEIAIEVRYFDYNLDELGIMTVKAKNHTSCACRTNVTLIK